MSGSERRSSKQKSKVRQVADDGGAMGLSSDQAHKLQELGERMSRRTQDLADRPQNYEWFDGQMVLDTYRESGHKPVGMLVFRRKQAGLTQAELGRRLGVPQSQISRIEKDPDRTSLGMLKRIAAVLGVPVRELV